MKIIYVTGLTQDPPRVYFTFHQFSIFGEGGTQEGSLISGFFCAESIPLLAKIMRDKALGISPALLNKGRVEKLKFQTYTVIFR